MRIEWSENGLSELQLLIPQIISLQFETKIRKQACHGIMRLH